MYKKVIISVGIVIIGIVVFMIGLDINNAEKNRCVRIIVNEDEIATGCDRYFKNDKWYKDFMKQMYEEYNKIK